MQDWTKNFDKSELRHLVEIYKAAKDIDFAHENDIVNLLHIPTFVDIIKRNTPQSSKMHTFLIHLLKGRISSPDLLREDEHTFRLRLTDNISEEELVKYAPNVKSTSTIVIPHMPKETKLKLDLGEFNWGDVGGRTVCADFVQEHVNQCMKDCYDKFEQELYRSMMFPREVMGTLTEKSDKNGNVFSEDAMKKAVDNISASMEWTVRNHIGTGYLNVRALSQFDSIDVMPTLEERPLTEEELQEQEAQELEESFVW